MNGPLVVMFRLNLFTGYQVIDDEDGHVEEIRKALNRDGATDHDDDTNRPEKVIEQGSGTR